MRCVQNFLTSCFLRIFFKKFIGKLLHAHIAFCVVFGHNSSGPPTTTLENGSTDNFFSHFVFFKVSWDSSYNISRRKQKGGQQNTCHWLELHCHVLAHLTKGPCCGWYLDPSNSCSCLSFFTPFWSCIKNLKVMPHCQKSMTSILPFWASLCSL